MHFKFKPWELKRHINELNLSQNVVICDDFILQKIIQDVLHNQLLPNAKKVFGEELNLDWIEDNIKTISMFSDVKDFIFINSDGIKKNFLIELLQNQNELYHAIFLFKKKPTNLEFKKEFVSIIEVEKVQFWEANKLFDFYADHLNLNLSSEAFDYALKIWGVEEANSFFHCLNFLKEMKPDGLIEVNDLKNFSEYSSFDPFEVVRLLNQKKIKEFWQSLVARVEEIDVIRSFSHFAQMHLLKLAHPESFSLKKTLNKFEKEIVQGSVNWTKIEISQLCFELSKIEIAAKKKDESFKLALLLNQIEQQFKLT